MAQVNNPGGTLVKMYTAPTGGSFSGAMRFTNRTAGALTITMQVRVAGAASNAKQDYFQASSLAANSTVTSASLVLDTTDEVWIAASGDVTFNLNGWETT